MTSAYEQWLVEERNWMLRYQKKTLCRVAVMAVAVPVLLALFMGVLPLTTGGDQQDMLKGALTGLLSGGAVVLLVFLCMLPGLSSSRISKSIEKEVKVLALNETEREQLGQEMLAALKDPRRVLDYDQVGPGSDHTPARFILSPHYACLQGGFPLVILVRLGDVGEIRPDQERGTAVTRSGRTNTTHFYTLYTIGFYDRDRSVYGRGDEELPDNAMGFFSEAIRDKVLWMLQNPPADHDGTARPPQV